MFEGIKSLGLDEQSFNSLLAVLLVLALVLAPQFLFTVPGADRVRLEAAIARRRAIGRNGAKKFREVMERTAVALGHTPR
jgi:hypothetical protein